MAVTGYLSNIRLGITAYSMFLCTSNTPVRVAVDLSVSYVYLYVPSSYSSASMVTEVNKPIANSIIFLISLIELVIWGTKIRKISMSPKF